MTKGTPNSDPLMDGVDWDALARYLAGESPEPEAVVVRQWLEEQPGRAELVKQLDRSLGRLAFAPPADLDVEGALRRVKGRLAADQPEVRPLRRTAARRFARPTVRWQWPLLQAAAVVVVVAGVLLWLASIHSTGAPSASSESRTFATGVGVRDSVRLPDGTRVVLGPGSQLVMAAGYGSKAREVALTGEAYFDVLHDTAHAFVVRAGNAAIRDVGTAFAVHADRGDGVRVAVTSGAVLFGLASELVGREWDYDKASPNGPIVLRPGDRGVFEPGGRPVAQRDSATKEDTAWMQGQLVFREASIPQVIADVRRWYGIELRIADPELASRHLTASFSNESRSQALDVIALALGARIERRGDTAIVRSARRG